MGRRKDQAPKGALNPKNTLEENLLIAEYGALGHDPIGKRMVAVYGLYRYYEEGIIDRDDLDESKAFQNSLRDLKKWFLGALWKLNVKQFQQFVDAAELLKRKLQGGESSDMMLLTAPVIRFAIKVRDNGIEWNIKNLTEHLNSEGILVFDEANVRRIRGKIDSTPRKPGRPKKHK
jgi:hypothetical protein